LVIAEAASQLTLAHVMISVEIRRRLDLDHEPWIEVSFKRAVSSRVATWIAHNTTVAHPIVEACVSVAVDPQARHVEELLWQFIHKAA
jgi:hypothetical protein